jgi:hypothetical protein
MCEYTILPINFDQHLLQPDPKKPNIALLFETSHYKVTQKYSSGLIF